MAYDTNELFVEATNPSQLRFFPTASQPKTFAGGTALLAKGTPVAFDDTLGHWVIWEGDYEVTTLTATGTPATAGDFTITVNGETTAAIAFNATPATMQAAIEALGVVNVGDVSVAEADGGIDAANGTVTITWGGSLRDRTLTVSFDQTGISAGDDFAVAETEAGVGERSLIKGFIWPDDVQLVAGSEVLGQVMLTGRLHRDDVPVVAASYSQAQLDAALAEQCRSLGIIVEGLASVR